MFVPYVSFPPSKPDKWERVGEGSLPHLTASGKPRELLLCSSPRQTVHISSQKELFYQKGLSLLKIKEHNMAESPPPHGLLERWESSEGAGRTEWPSEWAAVCLLVSQGCCTKYHKQGDKRNILPYGFEARCQKSRYLRGWSF